MDFLSEQRGAIAQNITSLPKLGELAEGVNALTSEELLKQLNRMLPGYSDLLNKGTELIQSQLRGEIPDDVVRETSRLAAERSRAGGYAGSQFSDNLTARDLGLTSLEITNQALSKADQWMARASRMTPTFDFTNMFVTPQQRMQIKLQENAAMFERDMIKSQVDAMPEAWEVALATFFDNIEETGQSVLGAYAGGAMGGGGGAAAGGTGGTGGMMSYGRG